MIMNGIIPTLLTQCLVVALIPSFNFLVTQYEASSPAGCVTRQTVQDVNKNAEPFSYLKMSLSSPVTGYAKSALFLLKFSSYYFSLMRVKHWNYACCFVWV